MSVTVVSVVFHTRMPPPLPAETLENPIQTPLVDRHTTVRSPIIGHLQEPPLTALAHHAACCLSHVSASAPLSKAVRSGIRMVPLGHLTIQSSSSSGSSRLCSPSTVTG